VLDDALRYVIQGVPIGCVYGLMALGLVLTYKTSGVFNLAFGAQAFLCAALYNELLDSGWSILPAAIVAVVIVAPLVGLLLDRLLFRFVRGSPWQVKLITALGLLVGLPEVVKLIFGREGVVNPPALVTNPEDVVHLGDQVLKAKDIVAISATVAVVVLLVVLFRYTALGLQMRGIAESPRMLELAGVSSERVGMAAWMLSSFMAGLAGVLLAPLYGLLDANSFTVLLVVAISAAAVGRLTSLPLAFAGAIGLGIAQQAFAGELDPSSPSELVRVLYEGLRPSLPFVVLLLVLILSPTFRNRREIVDPLRGVDPPPPNLAVTYHDARLRRINAIVFPTFVVAVVVLTQTWLSALWVSRFTDGIVLAVSLLSITVITGLGGEVSLAQATFSGIGGYAAAQLAVDHGFGTIPAMLAGAALATVAGALVAIPSLRLGGLYLTLATLAVALAADAVLFKLDDFTGGADGIFMPEPSVFGIALDTDRKFFLFAFAVFGIVGVLVLLLRKGTTGRQFAAIRGSEVAAPSIGINPTAARIKLFALSAGIAGLGGALFAVYLGSQFGVLNESNERFNVFFGVLLVVVVVTLGSRTVDGAVNAGLGFVLFPLLLEELSFPVELSIVGFAFGAITYARHPEGIVEFQKLKSIRAQIHHRAVTARVRALERTGRARHRLAPPVLVALCAVPALLLLAALLVAGVQLGPTEILVYGLVLGIPVGALALAVQHEVRRARGRGLGTLPAVGLLVLAGVGLVLALPDQLARLGREQGVRLGLGIGWVNGVFAAFMIALNITLQLRRGTEDAPTTLGWALMLAVGTIAIVSWLATVLWAVAEYRVHEAETSAAAEDAAMATVVTAAPAD
jgi:branched-subunit amino acid ABC-type transport system permease component